MKRTTKTLLAGTVGAAGLFLASTTNASASTTNVKVNQHDTVWALSQKYGVSIKSIETLNHIDGNSHLILVNQSLTIPEKGASANNVSSKDTTKISATSSVKVTNGDSLWKIANNYNISVDQLRSLNGLSSSETLILPGQELKVAGTPKVSEAPQATENNTTATQNTQTKAPAAAASTTTAQQETTPQVTVSANHVTYTVKAGDSLYTVAQAYGVSVDSLRAANKLGSTLSIGQTLTVNDPTKNPAAATQNSTQQTSSAATQSSTASTAQSSAQQTSPAATTQSSTASVAQSSAQQTSATATTQSSATSVAQNSNTTSTPAQSSSSTVQAQPAASSSVQTQSQNTQSAAVSTTNNNNNAAPQAKPVAAQQPAVSSGSITSVAYQVASMGIPYVTGGTSLSGFDCSGFTQYVYGKAGISIPRTSQEQSARGTATSVANAQVGDLLFWGGRGTAYHSGIYLGGSSYAAAPEPGENVSVKSFTYYQPSFAVHIN